MTRRAALVLRAGAEGEEGETLWFPDDLAYPHYLADPRAPHAGARLQFPAHREDDLKIENGLGRGHSALTQFFREHDHYWSAGVWMHW